MLFRSSLTAAGYGILKDGSLAAWADREAALGINLILSRVDADVVELTPDGESPSALRVVGARSVVRPVFTGGKLTGLRVECLVEANLAGEVNADYLGLCRAAALLAPWHKADLLNGVEMRDLTLTAQVEAVVQRSYHADG